MLALRVVCEWRGSGERTIGWCHFSLAVLVLGPTHITRLGNKCLNLLSHLPTLTNTFLMDTLFIGKSIKKSVRLRQEDYCRQKFEASLSNIGRLCFNKNKTSKIKWMGKIILNTGEWLILEWLILARGPGVIRRLQTKYAYGHDAPQLVQQFLNHFLFLKS